jgi:Protein of unknown function (DUF2950)
MKTVQLQTRHAGRRTANSNSERLIAMKTRRLLTAVGFRQNPLFVLAVLLMPFAGALLDGGRPLDAKTLAPEKTQTQTVKQETFSTPDEAMQALIKAATAKDHAALRKIFGPDSDQLFSGDPVEDNKDLGKFATAVQNSAKLQKDNDNQYTLVIGKKNWPTPIPIVKRNDQWLFDTKAGLEEILNRRIGENELSVIETCRAYVVAQWEYFTEGDSGHGAVAAYAQKFISSPGQHDGLYWDTAADEKPSPLGSLVATARAEGYGPKGKTKKAGPKRERHPYHGYYFKILTRQGPNAPGGKYNYIINGNMIAGFALAAFPDKWGNSGVMTFIVNQQGRVYEKNLGPDTAKIAGAMTEYNPDPSWDLVPR